MSDWVVTPARLEKLGHKRKSVVFISAICVLLASCGGDSGGGGTDQPGAGGFQAKIQRTTGGVPHVTGSDYANAGFGMGYVWAEDHGCVMSGRWLTVGAEASKRFGAEGPKFAFDARNGDLASDLYIKKLIDEGWLGKLMENTGPTGILPEVRELVRGYVAGYNQYLKEVNNKFTDPQCADADWIRPITERDVYLNATYWADMLTAVRNEFSGYLAAVPPGAPLTAPNKAATVLADIPAPKVTASNMIALGREATQSGNGMVFSNPHWEWGTADAMVAAHVTVPGKFNVNGMVFGASPVIGIGHNDKVGWGNTSAGAAVTNGVRYRLDLVPGSPTSYMVDGVRHEMVPTKVTVQVRNAAGTVAPYTHTFYETLFGTVSASAARPWTEKNAYTWKHSPLKVSGLNMWHMYGHAKTVDDINAADGAAMGVAWINTVAADTNGRAYRSMPTPLPYLTDAVRAQCVAQTGILDGTRGSCLPKNDPTAPFPGVFPASMIPTQFRNDYTFNTNDSHWISNLRKPLEGYPSLFGPERVPLSSRTRSAIQMIEERMAGTDGLPGKGFTLNTFMSVLFDGREFNQMWRPDLLQFCAELQKRPDAPAGLPQACEAIAAWGGTYHLDDAGAVLFKRFMERSGTSAARYVVPFNAADPYGTPSGLVKSDAVRDALYGAVNDLTTSGIPLNATLRKYQYRLVGSERIPLPGGNIFQRLNTTAFAGADGWQGIAGSSFIYWVELTPKGPVGKQIQVQGQSSNAKSPYFTSQTRMYSEGKFLDIRFTEAEIAADPNLTSKTVRAQ